jgi:hypothetical protein
MSESQSMPDRPSTSPAVQGLSPYEPLLAIEFSASLHLWDIMKTIWLGAFLVLYGFAMLLFWMLQWFLWDPLLCSTVVFIMSVLTVCSADAS